MLTIEHVTRTYKNGDKFIHAIDDISTHFEPGEFVFVLGASGSGKSTLLNALTGIDTEIDGNISIDGVDTSTFSKKDWAIYRNHYVGFIFQEYNLIEHLKVWENVALPLMFQGVSKSEAKERALEELKQVGLQKFSDKKPNQISGGQAQRVAIARALVTKPKVIMADEPTGALDTELGYKIISYLKSVTKDAIVIVVTHDEDLAHTYASRTIELSDGKVIKDTAPAVVESPKPNELSFNQPKMTLGMMFKFARNNVFSRFFRSISTATIVSIGYISIFLLSFLIFGINNSIMDTIGRFVPEDQYQIYSIENEEISETTLQTLQNLDEVEDIRYNVSEQVSFTTRNGDNAVLMLSAVPYDDSLLIENATLYGRYPSASNEILIDAGVAARIRSLNGVDEDSYQYIFDLVKGTQLSLQYIDYSNLDTEHAMELGNYQIVGMIGSQTAAMTTNVYTTYDEAIVLSDTIHDTPSYKEVAIVYLSITRDQDIDAFTIQLRDDYDLVLDNMYEAITGGIDEFMMTALKVFIAISSISLIVAGILIGIVVYTSVIERIKEIGILTAIGAKQVNIVGIFIFESAMLGFMSSIIAVILSLLLTRIINGLFRGFIEQPLNLLTNSDMSINLLTPELWIIAAVIAFSILYSMLAGLLPALRAARMNAVKALRRE